MDFSELRLYFKRRHHIYTKIIVIFALLISLIEIGRQTYVFGNFSKIISPNLCYAIFCVTPLVLLSMTKRFTVNWILVLFCAVGGVSLLLNRPVDNHYSVVRFCFFCGMLCLLSPLVNSIHIQSFRSYLWRYVVRLVQLVVILSIILYLKTSLFDGCGRMFMVVRHPMLLSSFAGFAAVTVSSRLLRGRNNDSVAAICFDCCSLAASLLVMIWGGSRGTILSVGAAEIYLFIIYYDRWKKLLWLLLALASTIVIISIVGGDATYRVKKKFEISKANNSLIFSRKQLWESRLEEFGEKPLLGIGFTNVTRVSTLYDNKIVDVTPHRSSMEEPGSSWLSVLSNTGKAGFCIVVVWTVGLFAAVRKRRKGGDINAPLFGALLIFMAVGGLFEGWFLYAGSASFFLYWLLTSMILDRSCPRYLINKSLIGTWHTL